MVLIRSGSNHSTLSMMQRRATKYEKYINVGNGMLQVVALVLFFCAIILLRYYHIQALSFWSSYFIIVPATMIALGIYTFLSCMFGFYATANAHRCSLVVYAIFMGMAFFGQLFSIFFAMELRTVVTQANIGAIEVNRVLSLYGIDSWVTSTWDDMQRRLHCCGGNNFQTGYNDYRNTPIGEQDSVPDSCCHNEAPGCGKNILSKQDAEIRNLIFLDGCLTYAMYQLNMDVVPMVVIYAILGTILSIIELILIVLAAAYVAQITRRKYREETVWNAMNMNNNERQPMDSGPMVGETDII